MPKEILLILISYGLSILLVLILAGAAVALNKLLFS